MRLSPSVAILRTQSDERLVALARGGSENAFQAIVERYRRPLQRASREVLSESRAEDAVQQAFIAAWMALQRGDEVVNLRAWLSRIARNTAINALRVRGYDFAELSGSLISGTAAPQDELERREVMRQTLAGLAALPERQREALLRSAVAGVAYAEIALDLGLSEGATRQLVLRARTAMRASASALVPWPLMQWVALHGRADPATRIAEIAAGGGAGAGAIAVIAKASVVAVVAGSAVVAPTVVRDHAPATARAGMETREAGRAQASASAAAPSRVQRVFVARPLSMPASGANTSTGRHVSDQGERRSSSDHGDAAAHERKPRQGARSDERDDGAADGRHGGASGARDEEDGQALGAQLAAHDVTSDPAGKAEVADGTQRHDSSGPGWLSDGGASDAPHLVAPDE